MILCGVQSVWAGGAGGAFTLLGEPEEGDHRSVPDHHPHLPRDHQRPAWIQRSELHTHTVVTRVIPNILSEQKSSVRLSYHTINFFTLSARPQVRHLSPALWKQRRSWSLSLLTCTSREWEYRESLAMVGDVRTVHVCICLRADKPSFFLCMSAQSVNIIFDPLRLPVRPDIWCSNHRCPCSTPSRL